MKLKYYLRGVGIGIIFAAIVLLVAHSINKSSEISDEDAIKRVKALGYTLERQSDSTGTMKDSEETDTSDTQTTEETTEQTQTTESQTGSSESQSEETAGGENTTETAVYIINTNNDTSWRQAFKTLENAGVIEDADDLYEYYNQKYEKTAYLMNGSHEIPYGSTYDEIIKLLSTKN